MEAVILAAGTGSRMKAGYNKVFMPLLDKTVLGHTLAAFEKAESIDKIVVVTGKEDIPRCMEIANACSKPVKVVEGGETRQQSSLRGILAASDEFVAIHDGARALITPEDIDSVSELAVRYGAAAVGSPCVDTMKLAKDGFILSTVDRNNLFKIYTPQCFKRNRLIELHNKAIKDEYEVTDDCSLYEWAGEEVKILEGDSLNIKLTTPEDIIIAEAVLKYKQNI